MRPSRLCALLAVALTAAACDGPTSRPTSPAPASPSSAQGGVSISGEARVGVSF